MEQMQERKPFNIDFAKRLIASKRHQLSPHMQAHAVEEIEWLRAKVADLEALMQPEIDRRVAEERAKMLERLREPSEGMQVAARRVAWETNISPDYKGIWQAMLAQYEKDNSHEG